MPDSYEYDVFLSHSSEDKPRVKVLAEKLRDAGVKVWLDEWCIEPGDHISWQVNEGLKKSRKIVVCLSKDAVESGWVWRECESRLFKDPLNKNKQFIPVLLETCEIPDILNGYLYVDYRQSDESSLLKLIKAVRGASPASPKAETASFPPENVSLSRLPNTDAQLFGRDEELQQLDEAWTNPSIKMVTLVAAGGVGKTALVNGWLNRMEAKHYGGAQRVYGWSFYSQGTSEARQASSDLFMDETLREFGDADPKLGSAWERGKRLANLIRRQRTLLILDGLEPLQYPEAIHQGKLKDQGMESLLKELGRSNPGLCVVTTRAAVRDLSTLESGPLRRIDLGFLTPEAGADFLASFKLKGTRREMMDASREYHGHALSLRLLGNYLAAVCDGEIRQRDSIPALTDDEAQGNHARRVLDSYDTWLEGTPELEILHLMGLFDRPAEPGAIQALLAEPVISDLTEKLAGLTKAQWKFALQRLRKLGLLIQADHDPEVLDAHPLIREHFAEHLKAHHAEAWQAAHLRLYDYFKALPEKLHGKFLPDTLEEMEPLFRAVTHGCLAGKPQETLDEVFWLRIRREAEHYSTRKLGAFASDLAAGSAFFTQPWRELAAGLREDDKAYVLIAAAFGLRAQGRIREAVETFEVAEAFYIEQRSRVTAARVSGNLSELRLTLGEVTRAAEAGGRSVRLADDSEDFFWRSSNRATYADALHQAGELKNAEVLFQQAEAIQRERQPEYPYLYSCQGYRYCNLLLSKGRWEEVLDRVAQTLEWGRKFKLSMMTLALEQLTLGRTHLHKAVAENAPLTDARCWLNHAVDGLRKAGARHEIPRGLIARAGLWRVMQDWDKARDDLDEATEIAQRGEMALFYVDIALEEARLAKDLGDSTTFDCQKTKAAELIQETGYKRRLKDLAEL
ncbi:MAG: TIR domain-containing protein [Magnetococcales bacterium]|nr:TIR domain-containing protein [Magnetococcales bacterium]